MKNSLTLFLLLACFHVYGQVIVTFAGNGGTPGFGGDGGPATAASLEYPEGLCADASGNIYFTDYYNYCIRKVNPLGIISTFAGIGGSSGFSGDGGQATAAQLLMLEGVSIDGSGNIYIGDELNDRVRVVSSAGIISTFAGISGGGFSGDGGQATAARLALPAFTYEDGSGNVYINDDENYCIRKVNSSGVINTFAGIGGVSGFSGDGGQATAAKLNKSGHICIDGSGNVYIPDIHNNRVRKVTPAGIISTFAGGGPALGDGGPATAAQLSYPFDLCMDAAGNLYIADAGNNRVRMVNPAGIITTIAGTGIAGFAGDGGPPTAAQLYGPEGICMDGSGNMYISDNANNRVRKICMPPALAIISGAASVVCTGTSIALTASLSGGVWSGVTGHASVSGGGVVTGISAGVDTIKYTLTNSCYFTTAVYPVTVNTVSAGSISGPDSVCTGATAMLTSSVAGGVWSSTSSYAGVGSASGIVTGLSAGAAVISYSVTNVCGTATATQTVNVITTPAVPPISGHHVICSDLADTLSDPLAGGVWSTTSPAVASVSASGIVSAVSIGTAVISYTATNACGAGAATYTVTVSQIPAVGAISGHSSLCIDSAITLTDTAAGGVWSAAGGAVSVGVTGVVTGLAAGIDTVRYTLANACGMATAYQLITVVNCDSGAGVAPVAYAADYVRVSPNPNKGSFVLDGYLAGMANGYVQMDMVDILGRCVYHDIVAVENGVISKRVITGDGIPAGIYIIKLKGDGVSEVVRFTLVR